MKRKICVVTGSRAEFGLLRRLMLLINDHTDLTLQVIATGMHLSHEFGCTYHEIEDAGFSIDAKVEMLLSSDSCTAVSKSIGLGMITFGDVFERLKPDLLILLGDRFEIFSAASSAMVLGIPIAHLHGGESTEGAIDEAMRHSITKMSHLHFVAADEYRKRVIQLGEHPDSVFNVGGLGVDAIKHTDLFSREELEKILDIKFSTQNLLITFHPQTIEFGMSSHEQMQALLYALDQLIDTTLIFTMSNADVGGRGIGSMLHKFVKEHSNAYVFDSLGQLKYYSCLAQVDGVIGNSSSGLLEAPSFNIGTINIGHRQKGRLKASSVIDCESDSISILESIKSLYSRDFNSVVNPYGDGGASESILEILNNHLLEKVPIKKFFNLTFKIP